MHEAEPAACWVALWSLSEKACLPQAPSALHGVCHLGSSRWDSQGNGWSELLAMLCCAVLCCAVP